MFFPATPESPPMFENKFLDGFSRVPWYLVPLVWVPALVASFAYGMLALNLDLLPSLGAAAGGLFVWTFSEYWLHRTLFHWVPRASWGPRFHFFLHGVHHDYINDRYRLVMPPAAAAVLAAMFYGLWWLLLGAWVFPFMAGKIAGYIAYDMTHYYVHHGHVRGAWFKRLRAHHMNHHHNKVERKFGVSTTLWDHVLGTYT
jgi:sterol desaturase/sphingolipid hydroxylase (fatty acid hydroxylase superfamily)